MNVQEEAEEEENEYPNRLVDEEKEKAMYICTRRASELQIKMSLRPKPLKRSTRGWMLLPYKSDMKIEGRQLIYKDKVDALRHKTKSQVLVPVTLTQRYKYD